MCASRTDSITPPWLQEVGVTQGYAAGLAMSVCTAFLGRVALLSIPTVQRACKANQETALSSFASSRYDCRSEQTINCPLGWLTNQENGCEDATGRPPGAQGAGHVAGLEHHRQEHPHDTSGNEPEGCRHTQQQPQGGKGRATGSARKHYTGRCRQQQLMHMCAKEMPACLPASHTACLLSTVLIISEASVRGPCLVQHNSTPTSRYSCLCSTPLHTLVAITVQRLPPKAAYTP
jgi:hypothetical protein